jgi:hypothetical protein
MNHSETQKYGLFLKRLNTVQMEKLLSTVLKELRRRDSDNVKSDVLAKTKALWKMREAASPSADSGPEIMGVS